MTKNIIDASHLYGYGSEFKVVQEEKEVNGQLVDTIKILVDSGNYTRSRTVPQFSVTKERRGNIEYSQCEDFDQISSAVENVVKPLRRWLITWDRPLNHGEDITKSFHEAICDNFTLVSDDLDRPCLQVRAVEITGGDSAEDIMKGLINLLEKRGLPKGTRIWVARIADEAVATL